MAMNPWWRQIWPIDKFYKFHMKRGAVYNIIPSSRHSIRNSLLHRHHHQIETFTLWQGIKLTESRPRSFWFARATTYRKKKSRNWNSWRHNLTKNYNNEKFSKKSYREGFVNFIKINLWNLQPCFGDSFGDGNGWSCCK